MVKVGHYYKYGTTKPTLIHVMARGYSVYHGECYMIETVGSRFIEPWSVVLVEKFSEMYSEISEEEWEDAQDKCVIEDVPSFVSRG